jgi:hypothetical protein
VEPWDRRQYRRDLPPPFPVLLRRRGGDGEIVAVVGTGADLSMGGMAVRVPPDTDPALLAGVWVATLDLPDGDGGAVRLDIDCAVAHRQAEPGGLRLGLEFYNVLAPGQGELRRHLRRFLLGSLSTPLVVLSGRRPAP